MATIAVPHHLVAAFNLLVACQTEDDQLSSIQIADMLYQMADAEDFRTLQERHQNDIDLFDEYDPLLL